MIFIIGANGFVGSAFVRWAEANGREYKAITRENYADMKGSSCDVLINANGNSRKPLAQKDPLLDFQMSVETVVKSTLDFKYGIYILLSSCDVYSHVSTPVGNRENDPIDVKQVSRYGFHKLTAEQYVQYGAPRWVVFRLGGMVGPGLKKNAVYDVLHGGPVWLDPASELQFMHTDEVAATAMSLCEGQTGNTINLCGTGVVSVGQMMDWAGGPVQVNPGSPTVRYEINTDLLNSLIRVSSSAETVKQFILSST
jgi:nucleoside-diphosphate-sugar epimerase